VSERPIAAFVLSLIGGILYLIAGIILALIGAFIGFLFSVFGAIGPGILISTLLALGLISGIIIIVGSVILFSNKRQNVVAGSILVLVFAIIGGFGTLFGFGIGFILCLIGAIIGLVWKSDATEP